MMDGISKQHEISLDTWSSLTIEERVAAFQQLPFSEADDFFLALSARDQAALVLALPPGERRIWMRLLPPDDATDLIQETPEDQRSGLLALLDDSARREVVALLAYAEDEAGGLMSPRFARLRPHMTVDEAISYLRRQAAIPDPRPQRSSSGPWLLAKSASGTGGVSCAVKSSPAWRWVACWVRLVWRALLSGKPSALVMVSTTSLSPSPSPEVSLAWCFSAPLPVRCCRSCCDASAWTPPAPPPHLSPPSSMLPVW